VPLSCCFYRPVTFLRRTKTKNSPVRDWRSTLHNWRFC